MVVALNGSLRIEQPMTADHGAALAAMKRMERDISLWAPSFTHYTEKGFFHGIEATMTAVAGLPGPKAIALFSMADGTGADSDFEMLATAAVESRCNIYPIDVRGLFADWPDTGEPPSRVPSVAPG